MASPAPVGSVSFEEFEAKLASRELYRKGVRVRLTDQSFQVLAMLLERPGELVTREEIRQHLWPADTFVDFDHGLNNAVNRVREALGDSADSPRFIETLPRRGYRFVAPVEFGLLGQSGTRLAGSPSSESATSSVPTSAIPLGIDTVEHTNHKRITANRILILVVIILALSVAVAMYWARLHPRAPQILSLAVLPLENVSGDENQEYFADGMTDSLITNLAGLQSVRVISRTSVMHYKGSRKTLPEIARELKVDAVVEGTVLRSGNRVRINAQLIDARTDRHLWASAYDRDLRDVVTMQEELATAIAGQIATHVEQQSPRKTSRTINPEAYDSYLRARQEWVHGAFTSDGYRKSRAFFDRAIQLDQNYPEPLVGLAETYITDDPAAARALASHALELNSNLGGAHTILALMKAANDWDFSGAESEFARGIELEPNSVTAHSWYGVFLAETGRSEDGLRELRRAESLDPLAPGVQSDLGLVLYLSHRYDEAEQVLQRLLRQDPHMTIAHRHLVRVYAAREQIPEYISEMLKANGWYNAPPAQLEANAKQLRAAYAGGGTQVFWRAYLEQETRKQTIKHPLGLARIYAHLGNRDSCIAILQKLYEQRDLMLAVWIRSDPEFDPVRSDPRFQSLLKKIGFIF